MENIWIYEVWGESWGIVKANNKKEAEEKVRKAYRKHDTGWWDVSRVVVIKSIYEDNNWFSDCPDVLEVYG